MVFYSFYHWEGILQISCVCLPAQNKVFWSHARKGTIWLFFSEIWHVVLLLITVSLQSSYYLCQMFICWGIFLLYFTFPYRLKLVDWPETKNAQSLNDSSTIHILSLTIFYESHWLFRGKIKSWLIWGWIKWKKKKHGEQPKGIILKKERKCSLTLYQHNRRQSNF